ncbi:chromate transporter [Bacillus suaedaesalsae]|uniref:Chromate transporter n=1 Tax=Bacillus suaedaesalsae TaxID=2810349 RepID=A0ABS2DFK7_9BACI|nr:chromate transporter [Bacillus suaedaesalsae]MBM6617252.1 chromate transporter [Bacillus suaedaesalsae]
MKTRNQSSMSILWEIFLTSSKLGLTSFGGPIAHLGYFHDEYVRRRKWIDEKSYADLVALCQFLPGPASSQVGIGIGVTRGGVLGGIVSFIGFTFPSVLVLMIFAYILASFDISTSGWIHGLKIVAVAIVAHAIVGMAQKLTPDTKRKTIALFALLITLLWQTAFSQVTVILIAALIGYFLYKNNKEEEHVPLHIPISKSFAIICISLFFGLLVLLPILRNVIDHSSIALFDSFYRSGALVFGGGHVVLPLLERELVPQGFISSEAFLTGYGMTQAVPGPLFTFAAYLGTVISGWQGGLLATIAIFLPAFLLVFGFLPFWNTLRNNRSIYGAWMGVNAAVVGILISAFYQPIWISSIMNEIDFVIAAILFSMLSYWKLSPWVVVVTGSVLGFLAYLL